MYRRKGRRYQLPAGRAGTGTRYSSDLHAGGRLRKDILAALEGKEKRLYGEYQKACRDMQEIMTITANIDTPLGYTKLGRKQNKEHSNTDTSGHVGSKLWVWDEPQQAASEPLWSWRHCLPAERPKMVRSVLPIHSAT